MSSSGSSRTFELAENLDFNVGRKQQMRVGFLLEGGRYQNFDARNANGTFTFATIDAFNADQPMTFTQRNGQVNTRFRQYNLGFYWSDDIRLNNKLSFGIGVRNEMQSHIDDHLNLMPRLGFTWTPWGNRTSIRGGYGLFYDWYESSLYDQTLRVDGVQQRDLLITYPGGRDPFRRYSRAVGFRRARRSRCRRCIRRRSASSVRSRRTCRCRRAIRCCGDAIRSARSISMHPTSLASGRIRRWARSRSSTRPATHKAIASSCEAPIGSRVATFS